MIWRIYLQKARNANASGDIELAFSHLKTMLKYRPSVSAKVLYGYYLMKKNRIAEATELFEKHIMNDRRILKPEKKNKNGKIILNKDELTAKTNYALCLWKNGNIDGAIELLEYVHRKMHTTDIYCNLGYLYILKGDLKKALRYNSFAYDFSPESNGICDNLGCTYYKMGEFKKAKEIYEEIMEHEKKPSFPECFYNYGLVLTEFSEYEKAKECFETALSLEFNGFSNVTEQDVKNALRNLSQRELPQQ